MCFLRLHPRNSEGLVVVTPVYQAPAAQRKSVRHGARTVFSRTETRATRAVAVAPMGQYAVVLDRVNTSLAVLAAAAI